MDVRPSAWNFSELHDPTTNLEFPVHDINKHASLRSLKFMGNPSMVSRLFCGTARNRQGSRPPKFVNNEIFAFCQLGRGTWLSFDPVSARLYRKHHKAGSAHAMNAEAWQQGKIPWRDRLPSQGNWLHSVPFTHQLSETTGMSHLGRYLLQCSLTSLLLWT